MKKENIISLAIIFSLMAFSCWYHDFKTIEFKMIDPKKMVEILSVFFLLALFMERALEVFVTTWRGGDASEIDLSIAKFKRKVIKLKALEDKLHDSAKKRGKTEPDSKDAKPEKTALVSSGKESLEWEIKAELDIAHKKLEKERLKKTIYKAHTQRLALWAGLVVGILVSAVGFRALESMVDPASICNHSQFQCMSFHAVDVFLTGCLIAGGSDGIHQFMQVYSNFMEQTAKRAKRDSHL